jgi:predicted alpha/beta hydrolase family esterase
MNFADVHRQNRFMSAAKQVLFIQGGGAGAYDMDAALAQSLRSCLRGDYQVHYPPMPDEADPRDEPWRRQIGTELEKMGGGVALVGHSVGAYVALKFVVADRRRTRFSGIFLIATPFVGEGGWQVDDMALPDRFTDMLPENAPLFLYHARDDQIVPFAHLGLYRQIIPGAIIREFETGGHQLNNDLSAVASDIRRVAE